MFSTAKKMLVIYSLNWGITVYKFLVWLLSVALKVWCCRRTTGLWWNRIRPLWCISLKGKVGCSSKSDCSGSPAVLLAPTYLAFAQQDQLSFLGVPFGLFLSTLVLCMRPWTNQQRAFLVINAKCMSFGVIPKVNIVSASHHGSKVQIIIGQIAQVLSKSNSVKEFTGNLGHVA